MDDRPILDNESRRTTEDLREAMALVERTTGVKVADQRRELAELGRGFGKVTAAEY
jgi:hypothetical protein